jgi:uncharacterized membrane protein YhaH (DUF805 family)
MSFTEAVTSCLHQYVGFQGRATRSEYWYFVLFAMGISLIGNLCNLSGLMIGHLIGLAMSLISLGILLPGLAAGVRRLHDLDKSGWWLLIGIIPLAGLILLYWFCLPGTNGPNRFGGGYRNLGPMPIPVGFN